MNVAPGSPYCGVRKCETGSPGYARAKRPAFSQERLLPRISKRLSREPLNAVYGREPEAKVIKQKLQEGKSLLLTGPHGIGKRAILHCCQRLLPEREFMEIDCEHAEPSSLAELVSRIDKVYKNALFCFRNVEKLTEKMHVSFPVIATTSDEEFTERGLEHFETLPVRPLLPIQITSAVQRHFLHCPLPDGMSFSDTAVRYAVCRAQLRKSKRALPGKAIRSLRKIAAAMQKEHYASLESRVIGHRDLIGYFNDDDSLEQWKAIDAVHRELKKRVVGQEEAVFHFSGVAADQILQCNERRFFYLIGAGESGKGYFVKLLARLMKMPLIFLDMSLEKGAGSLANRLLKEPGSLVWVEDFEKADPRIHKLFSFVKDYGYYKDGERRIDCSRALWIATSHASSPEELEALKNRLGEPLYHQLEKLLFYPLDEYQKKEALVLMLEQFRSKLKERYQIELQIDGEVYGFFSPESQSLKELRRSCEEGCNGAFKAAAMRLGGVPKGEKCLLRLEGGALFYEKCI